LSDALAHGAPSRAALDRAWSRRPGVIGWLGAVNHKAIGSRFVFTALFFFTLAGLDATVLRLQLATPNADFIDADTFAQLFTTHGSAMMFFFAVPFVEGLGMYFVPLMIGARDMPFPRLNALGYWLFLFGGMLLYFPTLADIGNFFLPGEPIPRYIPDGGWFAYPPLTSTTYSPDPGIDFWLVAVTLAEISAIIGAIEIVASICFTRARGMTLNRLPIFVWTILAIAVAILLAFPSIVTGSVMLELERKFGLPFFDAALGGHPLLWQHLFWIFGHPEVYIQFLPATGIISMVVPAFTRRQLVGYTLIVMSVLATALLSLGLWAHHMFATGIPWLGLTIFSASSMMIAIPSGIQVFAWLATLLAARRLTLSVPMLFVIGFLITFVIGGVTGVMVASVPFDLQVHDTYFVVAHFHYVLVGGVVFPILAGVYYWFPKLTGRFLSERLGRVVFALTLIGMNVTFFLQHNLGLLGMRRRVHTFDSGLGWDEMNFISTAGVFVFGAGLVLLAVDALRALRRPQAAEPNPWRAGSLEWAVPSPPPSFNFERLPRVTSREPLWDEHGGVLGEGAVTDAADAAGSGADEMAEAAPDEVGRETLATSLLDTRPMHVLVLPADSLKPLVVAMALAWAGFGIVLDLWPIVGLSAVVAVGAAVAWLWPDRWALDPPAPGRSLPYPDLPHRVHGPRAVPWWGLMLGLGVVGLVFLNIVLAYVFLAVMAPEWPPAGTIRPSADVPLLALTLVIAAVAPMWVTQWGVTRGQSGLLLTLMPLAAAIAGLIALAALLAHMVFGLPDPAASSFGAMAFLMHSAQALVLAVASAVSALVAVQAARGLFSTERYMAIDHSAVIWYFTAAMWLVVFAVLYVQPWL
jgi:cytochrome c oxidase subunit I+III